MKTVGVMASKTQAEKSSLNGCLAIARAQLRSTIQSLCNDKRNNNKTRIQYINLHIAQFIYFAISLGNLLSLFLMREQSERQKEKDSTEVITFFWHYSLRFGSCDEIAWVHVKLCHIHNLFAVLSKPTMIKLTTTMELKSTKNALFRKLISHVFCRIIIMRHAATTNHTIQIVG